MDMCISAVRGGSDRTSGDTILGVIYAVAKKKAGGESDLRDAIAKGEVKTAEIKGIKYYFFPEVSTSSVERIISGFQGPTLGDHW